MNRSKWSYSDPCRSGYDDPYANQGGTMSATNTDSAHAFAVETVERLTREREKERKGRRQAERDADYMRGALAIVGTSRDEAGLLAREAVRDSEERHATILTGADDD